MSRDYAFSNGHESVTFKSRSEPGPRCSSLKAEPETWQFHALASIDSDRFRDHESAITALSPPDDASPRDFTHRERAPRRCPCNLSSSNFLEEFIRMVVERRSSPRKRGQSDVEKGFPERIESPIGAGPGRPHLHKSTATKVEGRRTRPIFDRASAPISIT